MIKLKLIEGTSDEHDPSDPTKFYKLNFSTLFLNLNVNKTDKDQIQKKSKDMTFKEINSQIKEFKTRGIETFPLITELHKRIALAFSVVVFIIIGSGLAMITRRREKSINLSLSFAVTGIYYLLLLGASALALEGYLYPGLAMWLPNFILGLVGALIMVKLCVS